MIRLIARIDARNGNHIKTALCEGVKVIRPVVDTISNFSTGAQQHDELLIIDTVASLYDGQNWILKNTEDDFFYCPIPLAVGGAIRSVDDAQRTLARGADKIVVNTAALERPSLLEELSKYLGRQAVILQVDTRQIDGQYRCFTHGARELSYLKFSDWVSSASGLGVGEIHVTSIDTEGTDRSFPVELIELAKSLTNLPLILSGGITSCEQIKNIWSTYKIDSFSISSLTNRHGIEVAAIRKELASLGLHVRCPD